MFKDFFKRFIRYKVWFHMKSGATLYMGTCTDVVFKYDANFINSVNMKDRRTNRKAVSILSVSLSQIEAISSKKYFSFFM